MQPLQNAKDIWKKMFEHSNIQPSIKPPAEFYNKLARIFNVGPFYYYVFNVQKAEIEYVHPYVNTLLGCTEKEFTLAYAIDHIHPEDMAFFLDFEASAVAFLQSQPADKVLKYKIQYDFRIRKKDQSYIRVLQQSVTLEQGAHGEVIRALGMHTDISHIKKDGTPMLSFIGLDGMASYLDVTSSSPARPVEDILSKREKEILFYLICGQSSEEIASLLFLSKETVSTHRRNMLKKTNSKNTNELIARAIKGGHF